MGSDSGVTAIAPQLAEFAGLLPADDVPPAVRETALRHLLDTLGCGLAAVSHGAATAASRVVLDEGGSEQSSVLGTQQRVPAASAALANGALCHALDFDDTHERAICHVSAVVAPAAWAVAEAVDAPGPEVVAAYVVGSEVALRIGVAGADGFYARGFHPTSVAGVFGSTAAAGRLYGLSAREMAHALGIAGSFASGLFEYLSDGAATKPLHAGWAAQAGVRAAALAQAGAEGPATVIEGRFGLLASFGDGGIDLDAMTADLGARWETEQIALKLYPACHFAHAPTWAASQLRAEHSIEIAEIEEIVVRVPPEGEALVLEPLADKHAPGTPYGAKFSLPYTVAHVLLHDELGLAAFEPAAIGDPAVLELARRVRAEPWPGPPPSRFAGATAIHTRDGVVALTVDHPPGSPGNPASDELLVAKFVANAAPVLGDAAARRLSADALGDATEPAVPRPLGSPHRARML